MERKISEPTKETSEKVYISPAMPLTGRKIKMYKLLKKYLGVMVASTIMGFVLVE